MSDQQHNNSSSGHMECDRVSIFFEDDTITHIFSQLLEVRGVKTCVLNDISEFNGQTKIITEPRYFPMLDKSCHTRCLVIGNKDTLHNISALSLSRPLTEEKIETALSQFLSL